MHADAPVRAAGRGRGRNYVLPLAIVLIIGQIAAFVVIKLTKDKPAAPAASTVATTPLAGSSATAPTDPPPATIDAAPAAPVAEVPVTAPTITDPPVEPPPVVDEPKPSSSKSRREEAKEAKAREKAAKLAKEKEERAEKAERERREADERKRDADNRRASELEKQRLAAEAEKVRLAAERAKAEAAAELARLEAAKIKAAAAKASADKPKGSSSVLVLVLGPGVSNPSREAIKNVYLGKASVWPNGTTAHPMNRPAGSGAGRKFYGGILGMSSGEFREHWSQLQLSGGGISPSTVTSATTMIAKVAATRGGMGYVLESELPESTKGVTLVRLK